LIQWGDFSLLIDCGPDFRQQMLTHNVCQLDGIVFTHEHADHTAGLDDIRPFFSVKGILKCHLSARVQISLNAVLIIFLTSENKYPGAPSVDVNIITPETSFEFKGKSIIPIEVMHDKLPVLGYRIGDFCYLTDVKTISSQEQQKLQDLDYLSLELFKNRAAF
jgi:phosphoribosyl 1,2-cyclic phosphate phosphodiesterase